MPQLRSYTGFAGTPNIGSAVIGGAGIAQRAQEASMSAANERARISAQMAAANMEHQARMAAIQQDAMKQAQELEVQKAYQEAQLGLKQKEIDIQNAKVQDEIAQAAQQTQSRFAMEKQAMKLMGEGKTPTEAMTSGAAMYGPTSNLPSGFWSSLDNMQTKATIPGSIGDVSPAKGALGERGGYTIRTGPQSLQYIPPAAERTVTEVEGDPDKYAYGATLHEKPAAREAERLQKRRDRLEEKLDSAEYAPERTLMRKAADPKKAKEFSAGEKAQLEEYLKKLKQLEEMDAQINSLKASTRTNSPAKASVPMSGKSGRFEWTAE